MASKGSTKEEPTILEALKEGTQHKKRIETSRALNSLETYWEKVKRIYKLIMMLRVNLVASEARRADL